MTPLALRLVRQFIGDPSDEILPDPAKVAEKLLDAHCFECSDIMDLAADILDQKRYQKFEDCFFLPAPKTWIEWGSSQARWGVFLSEGPDGKFDAVGVKGGRGRVEQDGSTPFVEVLDPWSPRSREDQIVAFLVLINSPRVVGRRQHMPHAGLEKRLRLRMGRTGKFPLHAWTEIKLPVAAPEDLSGNPSVEAHYTGKRARHFVRAHLRIRDGKLILVKAHWRGDASLGTRRSRYKLVAA